MKLINIDYVSMYFDHGCENYQEQTTRIIKGQFGCFSCYANTINNMSGSSMTDVV